jgi:peptidoglycan-N-acetylglucosamine deacetylase
MNRIILMLLFLPLFLTTAQNDRPWNNKKCAVSLTYDDALNVHLDKVIPVLDSLGFTGTFYVPVSFAPIAERLEDWRAAAAEGHELGNHTIFHPCDGSLPGREWVNPDYDLHNYSYNRIVDEIKTANAYLHAIDGKTEHTFAYTCGDCTAGDSSFLGFIKDNFIAARGVAPASPAMDEVDLNNIPCYMVWHESADDLINIVKNAMKKNLLVVFLFHGVGGEHNINVPLEIHNELLNFLKDNEKDIWVAPLVEIAKFIVNKE